MTRLPELAPLQPSGPDPMDRPTSRSLHALRGVCLGALLSSFALGSFTLGALAPCTEAATAPMVLPSADRPDQVVVLDKGSAVPITGRILSSGLEEVVIETRGKERKLDASDILRIELGHVPDSYLEGRALARQGDASAAAEAYLRAAEDADASEVAKASARVNAIESLIRAGVVTPGSLTRASELAAAFTAEQATSREFPRAQRLEARALQLAGNPTDAATKFAAIFAGANGDQVPAGYTLFDCYDAGISAAECQLAAGDADSARQTYKKIASDLPGVLGRLEEDDPRATRLAALEHKATLGEGWALLASDKADQAKSFFESQAASDQPWLASAARIGLAESLAAAGDARAAQHAFARASATAVADDDLVARAMLGLAKTTLELEDPGARELARTLLDGILAEFPATPFAAEAAERSAAL